MPRNRRPQTQLKSTNKQTCWSPLKYLGYIYTFPPLAIQKVDEWHYKPILVYTTPSYKTDWAKPLTWPL